MRDKTLADFLHMIRNNNNTYISGKMTHFLKNWAKNLKDKESKIITNKIHW